MITVTKKAQEQVKAYFEGKTVQPIRIFVNHGCGGTCSSCGQGGSCCD